MELQRLARLLKLSVLQGWLLSLSEYERRRSEYADAQAGLRICCSHTPKKGFLATRPNYNLKTAVSFLLSLFLRINGKSCAGPEHFVRGGPNMTTFFFCFFFGGGGGEWGVGVEVEVREDQNTTKSGLSSARQLACR